MLLLAVAGWSFAEAILLFLVADIAISIVAVLQGWRAAVKAAFVAALAATAGGAASYLWAQGDPAGAHAAMLALPAIDGSLIAETAAELASGGNLAMLWGSLSGAPYKLYALAAGSGGRELFPFLLATPLVRLPRFLLAALLVSGISALLSRRLGLRLRLAILGLFWLIFYLWYFSTMPG